MDLTNSKYIEAPNFLVSHGKPPTEGNNGFFKKNTENPFADTFPDPLCKLNLKEASEFVRSLPMANHLLDSTDVSAQRRGEGLSSVAKRSFEAPPTPGRLIFSFSSGNFSRKSFPSKWDDAEKWLNGSNSCHDSPAHHLASKPFESLKFPAKHEELKPQAEVFAEKSRVTEENVSKEVSIDHGSVPLEHHISTRAFNGVSASEDAILKNKFTEESEVEPISPKFRCSEPVKEGFLFGKPADNCMKDAGTEMTPIGSSTTSRCHTPFMSTSPVRHNTPADRSGPLALINSGSTNSASTVDIEQLQDCHLTKLDIGTQFDSVVSTWSSREEEEEDVSKSLRHFEFTNECRRSVSETRAACNWGIEEKNNCCLRYQREEAKIQAWVNLQSAKAEAHSRKLEVKIEKMRSDLEEKLMKRMGGVHRKAEEWRATAQVQHSEQIQRHQYPRVTKKSQKLVVNRHHHSPFSGQTSCGCFPCNVI